MDSVVEIKKSNSIVILLEVASVKVAFEILGAITTRVAIEFTPNGFGMSSINDVSPGVKKGKGGKKTCIGKKPHQIDYKFPKEDLSKYDYNLVTNLGMPLSSYKVEVLVDEISTNIKNLKKNKLKLSITVDGDMNNTGILMYVTETGLVKHIEAPVVKSNTKYTDQFNKYYMNTNPIAKPFMNDFGNIVTGSTNANHSELQLCYNPITKNAYVYSWKRGFDKPSTACPLTEDDNDGNGEIDNNNVKKSIDLSECGWLTKISKLNPSAVLKIYMSQDGPLIFRTMIGSQGIATFSFAYVM